MGQRVQLKVPAQPVLAQAEWTRATPAPSPPDDASPAPVEPPAKPVTPEQEEELRRKLSPWGFTLVDGAKDAADASLVALGTAHQVNLHQDVVNYVNEFKREGE